MGQGKFPDNGKCLRRSCERRWQKGVRKSEQGLGIGVAQWPSKQRKKKTKNCVSRRVPRRIWGEGREAPHGVGEEMEGSYGVRRRKRVLGFLVIIL